MNNIRREDWTTLKPTVYGWGINDVNYKVQLKESLPSVDGKRRRKNIWSCPYYTDWCEIIRRSKSLKEKHRHPTYVDVTISEEWKYFSNFIRWVDKQPEKNWQSCDLDKDLLLNTKVYSPNACCYINPMVNTFINEKPNKRGKMLIGVTPVVKSKINPYCARCRNPFTSQGEYLGIFPTEYEAHKAWQAKKHEYACQLADLQDDPRVADALRQRYAPDKDWTKR